MGAVEDIKAVADLVKKFNDIELNRRILALENEVLDLSREKRRAEERIEELERSLRLNAELKFKEPFYWLGDDQTPFCAVCWEEGRKAIHVHYETSNNAKQYWTCPNCKTKYTSRGIPNRY